MMFWGKRKKTARSKSANLSIESLEDRSMMAVLAITSGETTSFRDADGTLVRVKLTGPGQGTIELTNGGLTAANIDNLTLTGTTAETKLKIIAKGGRVSGTSINELVIDNAMGQVGALKELYAPKVDIGAGGELTADGDIGNIKLRHLRAGAEVDVTGNVGKFQAKTLYSGAMVDVSGMIASFVADTLFAGAEVEADRIDYLNVKKNAYDATIDVGEGGLQYAKFKNVYNSNISADGILHEVYVKGTIMGSALASNIDPGSDGEFGTLDDTVVDQNMTGDIGKLYVKGLMGTGDQEVKLVSSDGVGDVQLSRKAAKSNPDPWIWEQATSQTISLSVLQAYAEATGHEDDEVYIAIFGSHIKTPKTGKTPNSKDTTYFYVDLQSGEPVYQATIPAPVSPGTTTPNLVTVPSHTIADFATSNAWGSKLFFKDPGPDHEFTGRIYISIGAPVQAQITTSGTVTSPSSSNNVDPATGTFYDFVEFTVTNPNSASDPPPVPVALSLDLDTSQVDAFGVPIVAQLFQPLAGGQSNFQVGFTGTTMSGQTTITGVSSTAGLAAGQPIYGKGIAAGTKILTAGGGTITVDTPIVVGGSGVAITAYVAPRYNYDFTGVVTSGSTTITGINDTTNLSTGDPVEGTGIAPGSTIQSIVNNTWTNGVSNNDGQVTLNNAATQSTPAMQTTALKALGAGPIGVSGTRDQVFEGNTSLLAFLQAQLAAGNEQARAFLQAAAPFNLAGPVGIDGATANGSAIIVTTANLDVLDTTNNAINVVEIQGVGGNTNANGVFQVLGQNISSTGFTLGSPIGNDYYAGGGAWTLINPITGVTYPNGGGNLTIMTDTGGLQNGNMVTISGVGGFAAANGTFAISGVTANSFTIPVSASTGGWPGGGTWAPAITGGTNNSGSPISVVTSNTGGLQNGDTVTITGVQGNVAANGTFTISGVSGSGFTLNGTNGNGNTLSGGTWALTSSISGASNTPATAIGITTADTTGLQNGDVVAISGVMGNTAANGYFTISNLTGSGFDLAAPVGNAVFNFPGTWARAVTGATTLNTTIQTGSTGTLANGDTVTVTGALGSLWLNGEFLVANVVSNTSFDLAAPVGNGPYANGTGTWTLPGGFGTGNITGASSNAGQAIVITTPSMLLPQVGAVIEIAGVLGNTAANGLFVVSAVDANAGTFTLGSPAGQTDYTSGGTWSSGGNNGAVNSVFNGGQILITTNTTGLANGDLVEVTGIGYNTTANGIYFISNVTPTGFVLDDSQGDGPFIYGGSWKQYWQQNTPLARLISPDDLVGQLTNPQDRSSLNNYFNDAVDDFFLQYLPSSQSFGPWQGGGQTFSVTSSASGTAYTYSGTVTNQNTANGGYVLRLNSSDPTDTTNYDVYYPWFATTNADGTVDTNAPPADIYQPLFPLGTIPSWVASASQQDLSASAMIFGCTGVFADNTGRGLGGTQSAILGDLENLISGSFNRGYFMNAASTWSDTTTWYPTGGTYNYWSQWWHQNGLMFSDLAYAFPFDDKFGASTNIGQSNIGVAQITLGGWSYTRDASATAFQMGSTTTTTQTGPVTFNVQVTGASPTGTVTFFVDGIALNESTNIGLTPLLDPIGIDMSGNATFSGNLPPTPDAANEHTYVVTAIYSGDTNNLPSIAYSTVIVQAV